MHSFESPFALVCPKSVSVCIQNFLFCFAAAAAAAAVVAVGLLSFFPSSARSPWNLVSLMW